MLTAIYVLHIYPEDRKERMNQSRVMKHNMTGIKWKRKAVLRGRESTIYIWLSRQKK